MTVESDHTDPLLPVPVDPPKAISRLTHYFSLTLSIPERTARAMGALVGGSTMLLTQTLIPAAIKNSSSYHFTVGMFQAFLVQNVAGMKEIKTDTRLKDRFIHRKLVGTSLEAAGLLTMHLSPVWVFAIASDAARGGQVFLQRLVQHLKENGVIAADSNPETLEQILKSIQDMSHRGATAIDTPPLSSEEIKRLADELRQSTSRLTANSSELLPGFESLWNQILLVARKERLSVPELLGMLSVQASSLSSAGINTAGALGRTGYGILDEMILSDYKQTLQGIAECGAGNYLSNHMTPFLENARSHFDLNRETATQRWFLKGWDRFKSKLLSNK